MKKTIVVLLLSGVALVGGAEPQISGTPSELLDHLTGLDAKRRLVRVAAEGEAKVVAERAIIRLEVRTEDRSLERALKENQSIRSRLVEELRRAGLPDNAVKFPQFSSIPEQGAFSGKVKNYKVANSLSVTIADEAQHLAVAKAIDDREEITLVAFEPEFGDLTDSRLEAIEDAGKKVNAKRATLEKAFGVKLEPATISGGNGIGGANETILGTLVTPHSSDGFLSKSVRNRAGGFDMSSVSPSFAGPATPFSLVSDLSFGETIIRVSVVVEFTLSPSR